MGHRSFKFREPALQAFKRIEDYGYNVDESKSCNLTRKETISFGQMHMETKPETNIECATDLSMDESIRANG